MTALREVHDASEPGQRRHETDVPVATRHAGDVVRVAIGIVVVLVSLLGVQRDRLTTFEADLFRLVNDLPSAFAQVLGPVMQVGNVLAAPVVGLVVLLLTRRRRWRVAIDVTTAGFVAWFAAKAVKSLVERPRPGGLVDEVHRIATTEGLGFVSGHSAVAAAIVTAAVPYVPRRIGRLLWILPWTVGVARIFYGAHLPLDIVGGVALGWAAGAAVHLVAGAPHRAPSLEEAAAVLRGAGMALHDVAVVPGTPRGSFPFVASLDGDVCFVKLLDPERRDRDLLFRVARFLAFRDVRDEASVTDASTQAHREAAMTLLARHQGARVPAIRSIESDSGRVWIVQDLIDGGRLDALAPAELTDAVLASLWGQARLLRQGRIAHRDLVASNVLVDRTGEVWLVDFAHAKTSTRGRALDDDVAELLATTAMLVGVPRAIDAAERVIGLGALARALPALQPYVLTAETRAQLRGTTTLAALRQEVSSRVHPGPTPPPVLVPALDAWIRHACVAVSALGAAGGLVMLGSPSDVVDVLSTPGFRWLGAAMVCVGVAVVTDAVTLLAGVERRFSIGRAALAVVADRHAEVFRDRREAHGTLVEHLRRAGVPSDEAAAALARWRLGRLAFSASALLVASVLVVVHGVDLEAPDDVGALAVLAVAAAGLELVAHRRRLAARAPTAPGHVPAPADGVMVVLAGFIGTVCEVVIPVAVVQAMGAAGVVTGAMAAAAIALLAARLMPIAEVSGLATVLLAAGFLVVGVPVAVAVTAAVLARVLQGWVPVAVGGLVDRSHHGR